MRWTVTRGSRRPPILDRPRFAWEMDAAGRRRAVDPRLEAVLRPVRVAVVLDAATALAFAYLEVVPGPPGLGLLLAWPVVGVLAVADLAAWEGTILGLQARPLLGSFLLLALAGILVRHPSLLPWGDRRLRGEDPRFPWWNLGAFLGTAFGVVACLGAWARRRRLALAAPAPVEARVPSEPLPAGCAAPREPLAVPQSAPSRAARVISGFGLSWMAGGVVESLRGHFWFGLVEVAVGVGWLVCQDTLLDRRTDRRLPRADRASLLPVLLVPLGGLALLVRAAWLLDLF